MLSDVPIVSAFLFAESAPGSTWEASPPGTAPDFDFDELDADAGKTGRWNDPCIVDAEIC